MSNKIPKDIPVSVDRMYHNYLYRVGLNPKTMHPVQNSEMEKSFYAGVSSLMVLLSQKTNEEELIRHMDAIDKELNLFWKQLM